MKTTWIIIVTWLRLLAWLLTLRRPHPCFWRYLTARQGQTTSFLIFYTRWPLKLKKRNWIPWILVFLKLSIFFAPDHCLLRMNTFCLELFFVLLSLSSERGFLKDIDLLWPFLHKAFWPSWKISIVYNKKEIAYQLFH